MYESTNEIDTGKDVRNVFPSLKLFINNFIILVNEVYQTMINLTWINSTVGPAMTFY